MKIDDFLIENKKYQQSLKYRLIFPMELYVNERYDVINKEENYILIFLFEQVM